MPRHITNPRKKRANPTRSSWARFRSGRKINGDNMGKGASKKANKIVKTARAAGYAIAKGVKSYEGYDYAKNTQGKSSLDAIISTAKGDIGFSPVTNTWSTDVVWDRWKYTAGFAAVDLTLDYVGAYKKITKLVRGLM